MNDPVNITLKVSKERVTDTLIIVGRTLLLGAPLSYYWALWAQKMTPPLEKRSDAYACSTEHCDPNIRLTERTLH